MPINRFIPTVLALAVAMSGCTDVSRPTDMPTGTLDPTLVFTRSCVGWECSLEGIVYEGSVSPGNELAGVTVRLSQNSYCSPTKGEHETTTGATGEFAFPVYVHDTDTFRIAIATEGYEAAHEMIGGFDCLYCSCPPLEIVLQPMD